MENLVEYLKRIYNKAIEEAGYIIKNINDSGNSNGELPVLVIVPGHGVYTGETHEDIANPGKWFTKYPQDIIHYLGHVLAGATVTQVLNQNNIPAILGFSGAAVNKEIEGEILKPPTTEASSYLTLLNHLYEYLSGHEGFEDLCRLGLIISDEMAYSSYPNFIGSIAAHYCLFGDTPHFVVVVGFGFKKERFEYYAKHHGIPIYYLGINNPDEDLEEARKAEQEVLRYVQKSGPMHPKLVEKRMRRGQPDWMENFIREAWEAGNDKNELIKVFETYKQNFGEAVIHGYQHPHTVSPTTTPAYA